MESIAGINIVSKMFILLGIYSVFVVIFAMYKYKKTNQKYFRSSLFTQIACIATLFLNAYTSRTIDNHTYYLTFACGFVSLLWVFFNTYVQYVNCKMYRISELIFMLTLQQLNVDWNEFYDLDETGRRSYAEKHFEDKIKGNYIVINGEKTCRTEWLMTWR